MGCNNTKNATVHVQSETNLGSQGSSEEDKGSDEEGFIKRRTWGSPAPPLPSIQQSKPEVPPITPPLSDDRSHPTTLSMERLTMERLVQQKGGAAFVIQDENSPAQNTPPPRRLQALKGARRISMEELIRKQREAEEKRQQILRQQTENLSRQHSKIKTNRESREFEMAQRLYIESEKRLNRVSLNREVALNDKIKKVRDHNKKVVNRKKRSLRDTANDNLSLSGKMEHDMGYNNSESESWADNDSLKNIYDQMEFISPSSGLASAVNNNNHSDDEFFS